MCWRRRRPRSQLCAPDSSEQVLCLNVPHSVCVCCVLAVTALTASAAGCQAAAAAAAARQDSCCRQLDERRMGAHPSAGAKHGSRRLLQAERRPAPRRIHTAVGLALRSGVQSAASSLSASAGCVHVRTCTHAWLVCCMTVYAYGRVRCSCDRAAWRGGQAGRRRRALVNVLQRICMAPAVAGLQQAAHAHTSASRATPRVTSVGV
jgi:hypothetical protein